MYIKYQEKFLGNAIDNNLIYFEKELVEEDIDNGITKKYYVVNINTNSIDMKVEVFLHKDFVMYIRRGLENYLINKIKVTLKMDLLKDYPYIHKETKKWLDIPKDIIENYSEDNESVEKEYLKYALKSANIFQMPQLDREYLNYFICHDQKELDNNTKSFIYIILDKFLDSLTKLPNRKLLHKTVNLEKEILFEIGNNSIEMKSIDKGYLVFSDLNNLKAMNDIYGHNNADILLISFGNILKKKYPHMAHFRTGGDEFISISEDFQEAEDLSSYLYSLSFNNDIKKLIFEEVDLVIEDNLLFFSSNGIDEINLEKKTLEETIDIAEEKMYVNKSFLHLEFGVYDRRSGGENSNLAGKISNEDIFKIKNSPKFLSKSVKEQYDFLSNVKKVSWELYSTNEELKEISNEEVKMVVEDKLKREQEKYKTLLDSIS